MRELAKCVYIPRSSFYDIICTDGMRHARWTDPLVLKSPTRSPSRSKYPPQPRRTNKKKRKESRGFYREGGTNKMKQKKIVLLLDFTENRPYAYRVSRFHGTAHTSTSEKNTSYIERESRAPAPPRLLLRRQWDHSRPPPPPPRSHGDITSRVPLYSSCTLRDIHETTTPSEKARFKDLKVFAIWWWRLEVVLSCLKRRASNLISAKNLQDERNQRKKYQLYTTESSRPPNKAYNATGNDYELKKPCFDLYMWRLKARHRTLAGRAVSWASRPASPAAESAPVDLSHLRTAAKREKKKAVKSLRA
ncbi:unnamed protein product [Trichogramma brassicae]|uniref:Uncharacterized protein n=1 Tax=Trichogramma brassicae TaxID=86971 RepID=A0A6H5I5B5_9HYME|nr:unnamed protein product [Trichogramma brassicae]